MGTSIATRRRASSLAVSFAVLLALGACSYGANIKTPAAPAVTEGQRLPLAMGVYYSPEFLSYIHRQTAGAGPHSVTFNVGNTSATHFSNVFASYFESAVQFPERPTPEQPAGGVVAVLIPQLESLEMTDPALYGWGGTWNTALVYRFQMVDPTGLPIANWLVRGNGSDGGVDWWGNAGQNIAGEAYSKALAAAGRNFVEGFAKEAQVREWMQAQGVQTTLRSLPWLRPARALTEKQPEKPL